MARVPMVQIASVVPSGCARATSAVPVLPPAPARFSTTTPPRSRDATPLATRRATMCVVPPGGKGTTTRTARSGACARPAPTGIARNRARRRRARRMAAAAPLLVEADIVGADDGAELLGVGAQPAAEGLGAVGLHLPAQLRDAGADRGLLQHLPQLGLDPGDNRLRRVALHQQALPGASV